MRFTLSILLLFSVKFCFAAQNTSLHKSDTTILTKDQYKLNGEEFLDKYGRDDSSRAFINFYFKKRSKWKQSLLINAGLIILFSIAIDAALNSVATATLSAAFGEVVLALYLTLFVDVSCIIIIVDGILLLTHSRKKLLQILNDYADGKPLPPNITRKRLFKKYLRLEQHPLLNSRLLVNPRN
jgi:hypothetical protein